MHWRLLRISGSILSTLFGPLSEAVDQIGLRSACSANFLLLVTEPAEYADPTNENNYADNLAAEAKIA